MTLDEQIAMATEAVSQPVPQVPAQPVPQTQAQSAPQVPAQPAPQTQAQSAPQVPAQPAPQSVPQAPVLDLNQAQQEAETVYAVGNIDFGQKISTRSIDSLPKIEKGDRVRITVLDNPFFVKVHKHETLGRILCWSTDTTMGQCCKDLDNPSVRYCMPVLVYCTMPGDPTVALPQGKSELKLMVLWDSNSWDSISEELIDRGGLASLHGVDFIAKSEDSYGSLKFKAQKESFRPQFQQVVDEAIVKWSNIGISKAITTVGRQLNDERYLKLTAQAVPPKMQDYSMSDITN